VVVGNREGIRLKPPLLIAAFLVVAIVSGLVSGVAVALLMDDDGPSIASRPEATASPAAAARTLTPEETIAQVAEAASSSVVTIFNEGEPRVENGLTVTTVNTGSGVIIDSRGFIVTNEHVIRAPGTLSVLLQTGEQRPAVVVSHDAPFTDLAVLQIPEGGLRPLAFGDSAELEVGQTVLAIGSALYEFGNSVTAGIVSGLGRRYLREGIYMEDLIQTDAAVNTGNSGGPLVTLEGRMVGMVANVVRRIDGAENVQGISFAISTRTIAPIIDSILRTGSFPRPYFGVEHVDLDVPTAAELGVGVSRGALVQDVLEDSPADEAGLQAGDVILTLGGAEINEGFTFLNTLAVVAPDERVPVSFLRGEDVMQTSVQLVPR
jgi:2-alkenal reductase